MNTVLTLIGVSITSFLGYLSYKNHSLKSSGDLQEEIENRLQPRYSIDPPQEAEVLPHIEWADNQIYYEVWHVEVYEKHWGAWKKWLPRGRFQGRTKVVYEFPGIELPSLPELRKHHLYRQPYVHSMDLESDEPVRIEVIYDSVDARNISLYVRQFSYLVRDTVFRVLNPEAEVKYEFFTAEGDEGERTFARIFDADVSESFTEK